MARTPASKVQFSVKNHAKKTYTLSFPTAQRWDFRLVNSAGVVLYTYTDDHEFLQVVGTSMVNHDDRLSYHEEVSFSDSRRAAFARPLQRLRR